MIWTTSKLAKANRQCQLNFVQQYIEKIKGRGIKASGGRIGDGVHEALDRCLRNPGLKTSEALDQACKEVQLTTKEVGEVFAFHSNIARFVARYRQFEESKSAVTHSEIKLAINKAFKPSKYMRDPSTIFRGKLDLLSLVDLPDGGKIAIIVDHKTGSMPKREDMRKEMLKHEEQFRSYALLVTAHFPEVTRIRCRIHFVREGAVANREGDYTREEVIRTLRPWLLKEISDGEEVAKLENPEPTKSWLCDYCQYKEYNCPIWSAKK